MSNGRSFRLVLHEEGPAARLYSVRWDTKTEDELTEFLVREDGKSCDAAEREKCEFTRCHRFCKRPDFFSKLTENLGWAVEERGFDTSFFTSREKYPYPLGGFYFGTCRLYGLRYGNDLFIAGNGGVKLDDAIQDSEFLRDYYEDMKYAARLIRSRLQREFDGDFPLDTRGRRRIPNNLQTFAPDDYEQATGDPK